ncbi:hypothetical protein HMPREF0972_00475 [Actinomyces sp. oral taxon 848 str. F0332]|nr:hypothetical protein HMPREF0972_00475 [Actinomyces sp. oral taxon 848 str. F0332]
MSTSLINSAGSPAPQTRWPTTSFVSSADVGRKYRLVKLVG